MRSNLRELDRSFSPSRSDSGGEPQVKPCEERVRGVRWFGGLCVTGTTYLCASFGHGRRAKRGHICFDILHNVLDESGIREVGDDDLESGDEVSERKMEARKKASHVSCTFKRRRQPWKPTSSAKL